MISEVVRTSWIHAASMSSSNAGLRRRVRTNKRSVRPVVAEGEQRRKRWVCVFYFKGHQVTLTAQGATEESYDYWLPMFNEAMMTAKIHDTMPENPPA